MLPGYHRWPLRLYFSVLVILIRGIANVKLDSLRILKQFPL